MKSIIFALALVASTGAFANSLTNLALVTSSAISLNGVPAKSSFVVPDANACHSAYDEFYRSEPGVYAYWALCESGTTPQIHDYIGPFDYDSSHCAWRNGTLIGGAPGPLDDHETAFQVPPVTPGTAVAQNFPVNKNAGTVAAWVNSVSLAPPGSTTVPFSLSALHGHSSVGLVVTSQNNSACFGGQFQNTTSTRFGSAVNGSVWLPTAKCGFAANTWHRLVETWANGYFDVYVDGVLASSAPYTGTLDDNVFLYQMFTMDQGITLSTAKVLVSNQAWTAVQVAEDYSPNLMPLPVGGVSVSSTQLGQIHRDVLGYADNNSDLSQPSLISGLKAGLVAAGVSSVRYANGFGGITADEEDWQGGTIACTYNMGVTTAAPNIPTQNRIDTYLPQIAQPLGLHIGFTANYATNPPRCNAGGDPNINGASLVDYVNNKKHYGVKYFEVGNELFSPLSEPDFHDNPNTGASYAQYEPAFYAGMKAKDPSISIGIPVADGVYNWLDYSLTVLKSASYDALVFHNYPIHDPVTDGTT